MTSKSRRQRLKRRGSFRENAIVFALVVLAFVLYVAADQRGIEQKWVTALLGTMLTFGTVIYSFRGRLLRWYVWASLGICMAVHVLAIWIVFKYVLATVSKVSPLFWIPISTIEIFFLLIATKRIETRLTGRREITRLTF
jgi:hypothetical protein